MQKVVFQDAEEITTRNLAIATNTSSLSCSEIASTNAASKHVSFHFFDIRT